MFNVKQVKPTCKAIMPTFPWVSQTGVLESVIRLKKKSFSTRILFSGLPVRPAQHWTQRGGEEHPQLFGGAIEGWTGCYQFTVRQQQGCEPERHQLRKHKTHVDHLQYSSVNKTHSYIFIIIFVGQVVSRTFSIIVVFMYASLPRITS